MLHTHCIPHRSTDPTRCIALLSRNMGTCNTWSWRETMCMEGGGWLYWHLQLKKKKEKTGVTIVPHCDLSTSSETMDYMCDRDHYVCPTSRQQQPSLDIFIVCQCKEDDISTKCWWVNASWSVITTLRGTSISIFYTLQWGKGVWLHLRLRLNLMWYNEADGKIWFQWLWNLKYRGTVQQLSNRIHSS
jgi:hypothetical protein